MKTNIPTWATWIPVSEKLPKNGGDYLITTEFDIGDKEPAREVRKSYFCYYSKKWLNICDGEKVSAWMPLPQSYKAESEDKG